MSNQSDEPKEPCDDCPPQEAPSEGGDLSVNLGEQVNMDDKVG